MVHICDECKNDRPQGCNTPIKDIVAVKGVGAVECKNFEPKTK